MDLFGSLMAGCQPGAGGFEGGAVMGSVGGDGGTFAEAMAQVVGAGLGSEKSGEVSERGCVEVLEDPDLIALLLGGSGVLAGGAVSGESGGSWDGVGEEPACEVVQGELVSGEPLAGEVLVRGGELGEGEGEVVDGEVVVGGESHLASALVGGKESERAIVAGEGSVAREVSSPELRSGWRGGSEVLGGVMGEAAEPVEDFLVGAEPAVDVRGRMAGAGDQGRGGEVGDGLDDEVGAEAGDVVESDLGDGEVVEAGKEKRGRLVVGEGERLAMGRVGGGGMQRVVLGSEDIGSGAEVSEKLEVRAAESARLVTGLELRGRILPGATGAKESVSVDFEGVKEDGTAVAQEANGMKTMRKADESATWGVQKVPGDVAGVAAADGGNLARLHMDRQGVLSLEIKAWDWMQRAPEVQVPVAEAGSVDGVAGVRGVSAVERVEQLIVREVMVVRQMKADSLTVVLRPDDRTEMVLQLNRKDGQLEAFVRCEPKAYEAFHRNWGQLQESMLQHQVQLLPLKQTPVTQYQASSESFTEQGGDGSEFSGRSSQRDEEGGERERRGVRGLSLEEEGGGLRRAVRVGHSRRVGGALGWESWA